MLTINVLSTDLTLKGTTVAINVVLTADMKDSDTGLPLDHSYSFSVSFTCTVKSLVLNTTIPNVSYTLGQGTL